LGSSGSFLGYEQVETVVTGGDPAQQRPRPRVERLHEEQPKAIAESLKRSAEHSKRRKSDPYRSAMSMLTFYLNRAGKNLPKQRREKLEAAKDELRALYGKR